MKRCMLLSLIAVGSAFASDFAGKWSGTLETRNNPVPRSDVHFVTLEQNGDSVTGTAGPKQEVQWPIKNAKVTGNQVTFMVEAAGRKMIIEYSLELKGSELNGAVELKNREGVSWNLYLKRAP